MNPGGVPTGIRSHDLWRGRQVRFRHTMPKRGCIPAFITTRRDFYQLCLGHKGGLLKRTDVHHRLSYNHKFFTSVHACAVQSHRLHVSPSWLGCSTIYVHYQKNQGAWQTHVCLVAVCMGHPIAGEVPRASVEAPWTPASLVPGCVLVPPLFLIAPTTRTDRVMVDPWRRACRLCHQKKCDVGVTCVSSMLLPVRDSGSRAAHFDEVLPNEKFGRPFLVVFGLV